MIFLIPERSSSLAILVPSYMSLQKMWYNISSGILLGKESRNSKSPTLEHSVLVNVTFYHFNNIIKDHISQYLVQHDDSNTI
jgi:hypothetical protein